MKALDEMCDDLGMMRLDEVLADPQQHTYRPSDTSGARRTSHRYEAG